MPPSNVHQEEVEVTITLPRDIVEWVDELKDMLGFKTRGPIISQLLRELQPEENDNERVPKVSDEIQRD